MFMGEDVKLESIPELLGKTRVEKFNGKMV
jgi:hypothetical protein